MKAAPLELKKDQLWLGAPHVPLVERGVALLPEGLKSWGPFAARVQSWDDLAAVEITAINRPERSALKELGNAALALVTANAFGDLEESELCVVVRGIDLGDVRDVRAFANWDGDLSDQDVAKAQQLCEHLIRNPTTRALLGTDMGRRAVLQAFSHADGPDALGVTLRALGDDSDV